MARKTQTQRREVQEHGGICGIKPDIDDVIGPHVPVHEPRLLVGKLARDSCLLVAGRRGQARTPEQLVEFDHRQPVISTRQTASVDLPAAPGLRR